MKRLVSFLAVFFSLVAAAGQNDSAPQFQSQLQNSGGTVIDPSTSELQTTGNASLATIATNTASPPPDITQTGTLTGLGSQVTLNLNGQSSLNVEVYGTWSGTITVIEPGNVVSHQLYVQAQSAMAIVSTITANGNYRVSGIPTAGSVTVQFSSYTSGTASISMRASTAAFFVQPLQLNAANFLTSSWLMDGTGNAISSTSGSINANVTASALPTGAATSALQTTANTSLASIDAGIPASLGQTTMSSSMPVAIASDQTAIPTTARSAITANAGADVSVTSTSTAVLGANANRKGLILINASSMQITIAFGGQTPTYQVGLTLLPGGVFNMDQYSFTTGAVNAISNGAGALLQVQEFQ